MLFDQCWYITLEYVMCTTLCQLTLQQCTYIYSHISFSCIHSFLTLLIAPIFTLLYFPQDMGHPDLRIRTLSQSLLKLIYKHVCASLFKVSCVRQSIDTILVCYGSMPCSHQVQFYELNPYLPFSLLYLCSLHCSILFALYCYTSRLHHFPC